MATPKYSTACYAVCAMMAVLIADRLLLHGDSRQNSDLLPAITSAAQARGDAAAERREARERVYWRQHRAAVAYLDAHFKDLDGPSLWDVLAPFYSCDVVERVGGVVDGGKWLCDRARLLNHSSCAVFSLGSWGDTSFEEAILAEAPHCAVHTFDHTLSPEAKRRVQSVHGVTFHDQGICSDGQLAAADSSGSFAELEALSGKAEGGFVSIRRAMADSNLQWLDILKMDIEGAEWPVFWDLLNGDQNIPITQILVEIHPWWLEKFKGHFPGSRNEAVAGLFRGLWSHGYRAFRSEPNFHSVDALEFVEYSFLRVDDQTGEIVTGPGRGL